VDRVIQVLIVFLAGAVIGGLSWERYQLREANSQWKQETERAQAATAQALAAERRLANAQSKRAQAAQQLEATVNVSTLRDCPVPNDIARMLTTAADETRAD
jgi:HAMP domain-containing protein